MWQKKGCSTFIVISKSHAGHILESTYYVSYSQCWILFCCVLTIWQWWCFLIEYKKHSLWKAFRCCMTSMLCVKAMDYLFTMKPLLQTKHLWENKPPRPGIILLSFPTMTCLKSHDKRQKDTDCWTTHIAYCPIMTWTQHNNLDLNLDTSVCQLKHNAAFCMTLKHKTRSQPLDRNIHLNHRRKHHLHPPFHHGNMVNDIKMTSVQQHWTPIPTIKCPNCMAALTFWVSSSFNTWPLKSWLSYCGGKHKCIQKSIMWNWREGAKSHYEKRKRSSLLIS